MANQPIKYVYIINFVLKSKRSKWSEIAKQLPSWSWPLDLLITLQTRVISSGLCPVHDRLSSLSGFILNHSLFFELMSNGYVRGLIPSFRPIHIAFVDAKNENISHYLYLKHTVIIVQPNKMGSK